MKRFEEFRSEVPRLKRLAVSVAVSISVFAVTALAMVGAPTGAEPFPVYDGLNNGDKPSLAYMGLEDIEVGYRGRFFADGDTSRGDEAKVRETARWVVDRGSGILVIDIEHWPLDIRTNSRTEVQESIEKFREIVSWLRDERPQIKLGLYRGVPIRDYWTPVKFERNEASGEMYTRYNEWKEANEFLTPLAELLDFIMPSFYTFYEDREGWATEVRHMLEEARTFGKPVLPFVTARYHPAAKPERLAWEPLPVDYWLFQLGMLHDLCADGIVLWGATRHRWGNEQDLPWVAAAGDFAASHPAKPAHCPSR